MKSPLSFLGMLAKSLKGTDRSGDGALALQHIEAGNQHEDAGRLAEAEEAYGAAIALAPHVAKTHLNMGNLTLLRNEIDAAKNHYRTALNCEPDYAPAHYNLGNCLARQNQPEAAEWHYRRALSLKPDFADAAIALGNLQAERRQFEEAIASFKRAQSIAPKYAEAYYCQATAERHIGLLEAAEANCKIAIELKPNFADAYICLGGALRQQSRAAEALQAFQKGASLTGEPGYPISQAFACAGQLCDWPARDHIEALLKRLVQESASGVAPFSLIAMDISADLHRQASHTYASGQVKGVLAPTPERRAPRNLNVPLRVGYISADFMEHATMHLIGGVLESHDATRVQVHCYSYGPVHDAQTRRVQRNCSVFRDIANMSDQAAADAIRSDSLDLLIDLKGFTQHYRPGITAHRPAPVIVNWLGYPGTLGHRALADYIIGDRFVTPPESASDFSETLALMPDCYQPNDRSRRIGTRPSRESEGLPQSGFIFCSFNQSYKFNAETMDAWCELLRDIPGSVLWLLKPIDQAQENLRAEARARGITPERLVFADNRPLEQHLGRLQLADLALDTYPCNSHTTASDALWAGVPMVTLYGKTFAGRVCASILHAAGLPEMVCQSWGEYCRLARDLAFDPVRLLSIRQRLQDSRLSCPLFDTARFTKGLETLYLQIMLHREQQDTSPFVSA